MQYNNQFVVQEEKKVLRWAIGSILSFVIAGFILVIMFAVIAFGEIYYPKVLENNELFNALIGLLALGTILLNLLGIGLGIGGIVQQNSNNILSIAGIILNILPILILIAIIIVGLFAT